MKPVIITAATSLELSLIISRLGGKERFQIAHNEAFKGEMSGWEVIVAETGIGKINAAITVTSLLERFVPELLINTGCGGAYPGSGLVVGDLALATIEVLGDEGVLTLEGWRSLDLIRIPSVELRGERYFNHFPLTRWASDKALHVAETTGVALHPGAFVTVSTASGTLERGRELQGRFGGICENMEGGAVAQVALRYGVDAMEVRGISNLVEDRDLSRWNIPLAVERAQDFIAGFIGTLCRTD